MNSTIQRNVFGSLLVLALAALACSVPGQASGTVPTIALPTMTLPTLAPAPTRTLAPPPTPCGLGDLKSAGGVDVSNWQVTCDEHYGFGFKYPSGGPANPPTDNTGRIFLPITPNTTLVEKYMDVLPAPGTTECSSVEAQGYEAGTIPTENVTINGLDFKKQSGDGAAAGSQYIWEAYSTSHVDRCVTLTFVLHDTSAGNYATPPAEADRAAESVVFGIILQTFRWTAP